MTPLPFASLIDAPPVRRATFAVQRCRTRYAPDSRVSVFDLRVEADPLRLTGVVSSDSLRQHALDAARDAVEKPVDSDVTVLETLATPVTTDERVLAVRSEPDSDAERVTELRYGAPATAYDATGRWRRIRAPDGYVGWVEARGCCDPVSFDPNGFVNSDDVRADGVSIPLGTECQHVEDRHVRFRTGVEADVDATDVDPFDLSAASPGDSIVAHARRYLGTPYRWGGKTASGIDCSGLVWVAYYRHGIVLPRDTDQQRWVGEPVARKDLGPGDLLFFPGHVAISTGGSSFLHASGSANEVTENSLDPSAPDYTPDLEESYDCARRLL